MFDRRTFFVVCLVAASLVGALAPGAAGAGEPVDREREDPARWRLLGDFRGTTSSRLGQQVSDLLFEEENDGDLYQDLGDLSLGLGFDADDANFDWDNSFYRRVLPWHAELDPGETLTGGDLSRYVDVQSIVSRTRLRYDFPPDLVGDVGVGISVEGGTSLTLARAREPLVLGDRPLAEVLAERGRDDFQELLTDKPPLAERSLVRLTAEGLAAMARGIARSVRKTADTERGVIFYQNVADPITLRFDVGIPVPAELFTAADDRLKVGDRVRHVTFRGYSPLAAGFKELGLEARYQGFFRFLRETTIVKEPDDHALVKVRDVMVRGHELVPLKVRPEVRLLEIFKLGYTFFEHRMDRGRTAVAKSVHRVDLGDARGMESFKALLGEGERVRLRPLAETARERRGAELLDVETRRGGRRLRSTRLRLFSWLRFGDRKTIASELVETEDRALREIVVARSRELRKRLGRDRDWKKQFLVSSQGSPQLVGASGEDPPAAESVAVNLLTGLQQGRADGARVRLVANLLAHAIEPHPILDALAEIPPDERTRFFANLYLSFGRDHLLRFERAGDDEIWAELAAILLGAEHRDAWADDGARARFRKREVRRDYRDLLAGSLASLPNPTLHEPFDVRDRFRLAAGTVKKFHRIQELIRAGECMPCVADAFTKWKHIVLLQMLMFRLAADAGPSAPGYHYEVFSDRMLSPATVGNRVSYGLAAGGRPAEVAPEESAPEDAGPEDVHRRIGRAQSDWIGTKTLVDPSRPRLRAGSLYLNVDPEEQTAPCWKLRLFSDLRFAPELALRIDLRRSGGATADVVLETAHFRLGEPTEVIETPFMTARYYYDLALPAVPGLEGRRGYTLLLRILNAQGLPVSEEQQLRFEWPAAGFAEAPARCRGVPEPSPPGGG